MLELIKEVWVRGIPCIFHLVTGFYCPGCGGTRAVKAFLHGDFAASFRYHPLIVYTALVVVLEAGTWALSKLFHRPGLYIRHYDWFVYLGIAVIFINWIWKDYMLLARGIDLLQF